jgi:hypothetical protein
VKVAVAGSDSARLLLAHHFERLRQPAQRGERRARDAREIDETAEHAGIAIMAIRRWNVTMPLQDSRHDRTDHASLAAPARLCALRRAV